MKASITVTQGHIEDLLVNTFILVHPLGRISNTTGAVIQQQPGFDVDSGGRIVHIYKLPDCGPVKLSVPNFY